MEHPSLHKPCSTLDEYLALARENEDLKSEMRLINTAIDNIKEIRTLLIDKEKEFCLEDQRLRASSIGRVQDALRKRCFKLIDHLVHYKFIVECLATDVLNMENSLMNDDEYVKLSLSHREVEHTLLQAIKINQNMNEAFSAWYDEEAQSHLSEVESKWRKEHDARRKLISQLIHNQNRFVVYKATSNLEQQQILLNKRYMLINGLIKMSYNHLNMNDRQSIPKDDFNK